MHVEDEGIAVREFNQTHAKKRRARKVEFKIRLFPDRLLDAVLTLSFLHFQGEGLRRLNHLHKLALHDLEVRAERLMAHDQCIERFLKLLFIEAPLNAEAPGHVVGA